MKIVPYNIKGFHDTVKAKALWTWLFIEDVDVCCIQEHKMHHLLARNILHYRGYILIYGGISGSYSGTLTCVKNTFNPIVHMNHSLGRCLGASTQSSLGTILIYNVYAFLRGCTIKKFSVPREFNGRVFLISFFNKI